MRTVEVIIAGAGVIGLAIARSLAQSGREVVVLERNERIGEETSSRNSGVIHSGIYYPPGSLKATLCVRGRDLLYDYCRERGITHRRVGKIVVAQTDQLAALQALQDRGVENGVTDLQWLGGAAVRALEPQVMCAAGLLSPTTGIIDVHEYLVSMHGDLERAGGIVALRSELLNGRSAGDGMIATIRSQSETMLLGCRWLINCAGLHATALLTQMDPYPARLRRKPYFAKGNYFAYRGGRPFNRLVYPMPTESALGVHATLGLDGTTRFGPDVEWVDTMHYDVDPGRVDAFYAAIRPYWPSIPEGSLQPAYAGIRPKLSAADAKTADFVIEGPAAHSVPGLINLLGIESPGLTASLAIAEHVARMVDSQAYSRAQSVASSQPSLK